MLCLWRPTFNHVRRSLDGFTSTIAPIRAAVRAPVYLGTQAYVLFRIGPALIEIRRNPHKNVQQRPFFVARGVPP